MRKPLLIALFVLPWTLLALVLWWWVGTLQPVIDVSDAGHRDARAAFFVDLAYEGCVSREAVIAASEERGWEWTAIGQPHWCHAPELRDWIAVQIDPPLPFSSDDENAAHFGFDANACMAQWEFTACE